MFDQIKYQNDYNRENYARLSVLVKKNDKPNIEQHWKNKGYKSFNAYVNELIRKDMNDNSMGVNIKQSGAFNNIKIGK